MPGGARPGAGRKKGGHNKTTAEVKDLLRQYVPSAVKELARLSGKAKSEQARLMAIAQILDRVYGKPAQSVAVSGGGTVQFILEGFAPAPKIIDGELADGAPRRREPIAVASASPALLQIEED